MTLNLCRIINHVFSKNHASTCLTDARIRNPFMSVAMALLHINCYQNNIVLTQDSDVMAHYPGMPFQVRGVNKSSNMCFIEME